MNKTQSLFQNKTATVVLALTVSALWGSLFPCIKIGYREFAVASWDVASILLFAGLRFFLSGFLLVGAYSVRQKEFRIPTGRAFDSVFLVSFLTVIAHYALTYVGLSLAESSKSSVLKQIGFLLIPCFIFLFRKDNRFSVNELFGAILGFGTVISVNLDGSGFAFGIGEGMIVAASFCSAIGQIISKRVYETYAPAYIVAWGQFIGGAVLIAAGLGFGGRLGAITPGAVAILAYICAASITANLLWNTLIKYNDISRLAILKCFDPLFASVFSGWLLAENVLKPTYLLALLFGVAATAISNVRPRRKNE